MAIHRKQSLPSVGDRARSDEAWMRQALACAEHAREAGEVPVGAVVVRDGQCIATGWNQPIGQHDPSAHAEIMALRAAANRLGNYRLPGCEIYVTLEPCIMCAGAIIHARIARVVFGARDPRAGAVDSVYDVLSVPRLNHVVQWQGGIMALQCGQQLKDFFRERRS